MIILAFTFVLRFLNSALVTLCFYGALFYLLPLK